MDRLYDAVIVGGGPAGLTAAIYLARAKYKVIVLEKEKIGGQITITSEVVNYPGVARTTGKALTDQMYRQAKSFGAEFAIAEVRSLDLEGDIKRIETAAGTYEALAVILATGANPRKAGFAGEEEFRGRGVAYCATCDGEFFTGLDVFVIGGGFAAVEESMFLTKYARSVTLVVRKDRLACAETIADELERYPNISVAFNTEIVEAGGDGMLRYAVLKDNRTGQTRRYEPDGAAFGIFVFAGYVPNTKLFAHIVALDEAGYVLTDRDGRTNIDGVYAAGDLCVKNLRQVVTAVSDGAAAAAAAEKYAAAMHDKLNLAEFARPEARRDVETETAGTGSAEDRDSFISADIQARLVPVFEKFSGSVIVKAWLGDDELSREMGRFLPELEGLTEKVSCVSEPVRDGMEPGLEILRSDGSPSGIFFHGVPGGHEFNSFILALYNAAGPGQALSEPVQEALAGIAREGQRRRVQIAVSLACTMCPDVVMGAQRLAAASPYITAEMYDLAYFPDLRQRYNIMSVPCMIIDEENVSFGRKTIEDIARLLYPNA